MARPHMGGTTTARARRRAAAVALLGLPAVVGVAGCLPRERSTEAFCEQLRQLEDLDEVLAGGDAAGTRARADHLNELQAIAPEDVEPHVARLATVTGDLADTVATVPDPAAAASEVFTRRQGEIPEITAAGRAVEAYAQEHCRVELNPATTVDPAGIAPSTAPSTREATSTTKKAPTTRRRSTTTTRRRATTTSRRSTTTRSKSRTTTTRRSATTRSTSTTTTRRR